MIKYDINPKKRRKLKWYYDFRCPILNEYNYVSQKLFNYIQKICKKFNLKCVDVKPKTFESYGLIYISDNSWKHLKNKNKFKYYVDLFEIYGFNIKIHEVE